MIRRTTFAIVYVRWSERPGDPSLAALVDQLAREASTPISVCVVDNRPGIAPINATVPALSTIAGDNSAREFSGYEVGLRHVWGGGISADVWILANDRVDAYGLDAVGLLRDGTLDVAASLPCVLGQMDSWPAPAPLLGVDVTYWARSNLLVLPEHSLRNIGSLVSVDAREFDSLVSEDPPDSSTLANPALALQSVGTTWSAFAAEWLTGVGGSLRSHWYRAAPLEPSTWSAFRGKVHSVVNEQLLSARLSASGTPLVSLQLAAEVGGLPASCVRRLTTSAVWRWPTRSAAIAGRRGVVRAVRSWASVEASVRTGLRRVLR